MTGAMGTEPVSGSHVAVTSTGTGDSRSLGEIVGDLRDRKSVV